MSPFPSPLGAVAFGTLVISAMYSYVWWQYRERYVATWSAAWAMYSLRYLLLLLTTTDPGQGALRLAYQVSDVVATLLLVRGTIDFLGIRPGRTGASLLAALLTADVGWLAAATIAHVPTYSLSLPNRLLLGGVSAWLGVSMLASSRLLGIGSRVAGLAMIVVGLERAAQVGYGLPFLDSSLGRFSYIVAEAVVALGLFLAYFERGRNLLLASEERFRRLAEDAPDILVRWRTTRPRGCEYCSPAVYEVLGYRPEQVVGDPGLLPRLVHPEDRRLLLHAARHGQAAGSGLLLRLLHAGGAIVWAEVRFNCTTGRDGDPALVDAIVRDVSERVRMQEQLVQSQQLEMVAQLAGGVAHEFNNLIMAVNGHATFAAEALPAGSPARQDLEVVLASGQRAAVLTRQLLAFSRRQLLHRERLDLNEQVRQFCSVASHLVRPSVEVQMELESGLPWVDADPGQMQEVLTTLAGNASDAMPHGGTLTIGTARKSMPADALGLAGGATAGDYVCLRVSDTGTGMSEDVRRHLFEPFYTTKGYTRGTGLGLASVYGVVKQHQGQIAVSSEVGRGTSIGIYLPVSKSAEPAAAAPASDAVT